MCPIEIGDEIIRNIPEQIAKNQEDIEELKSHIPYEPVFYNKAEVDDLLSQKADSDSVYTKGETDVLLASKADSDSVYTKDETNTLLTNQLKRYYTTISVIFSDNTEVTFIYIGNLSVSQLSEIDTSSWGTFSNVLDFLMANSHSPYMELVLSGSSYPILGIDDSSINVLIYYLLGGTITSYSVDRTDSITSVSFSDVSLITY